MLWPYASQDMKLGTRRLQVQHLIFVGSSEPLAGGGHWRGVQSSHAGHGHGGSSRSQDRLGSSVASVIVSAGSREEACCARQSASSSSSTSITSGLREVQDHLV